MKKLLITSLIFVSIATNIYSQVYYKKIEYTGGGTFNPNIPKGYQFYLYGHVPLNVDQIVFTLNGQPFFWDRVDPGQTTFTIFVSNKIPISNVAASYNIQFRTTAVAASQKAAFNAATNNAAADVQYEDAGNTSSVTAKPTNFSTVIGIGVSAIGRPSLPAYDMIGYAALKFRIKKLDKSLRYTVENDQNIYTNQAQRFSIMLGGIVTDMAYQGRSLGNPVFNTKPMLGLSIDLTPDISIDLGIFGFDYLNSDPTIMPPVNAKVKLGTFAAISVDADAFNRLSTLLRGAPYNKVSNE